MVLALKTKAKLNKTRIKELFKPKKTRTKTENAAEEREKQPRDQEIDSVSTCCSEFSVNLKETDYVSQSQLLQYSIFDHSIFIPTV